MFCSTLIVMAALGSISPGLLTCNTKKVGFLIPFYHGELFFFMQIRDRDKWIVGGRAWSNSIIWQCPSIPLHMSGDLIPTPPECEHSPTVHGTFLFGRPKPLRLAIYNTILPSVAPYFYFIFFLSFPNFSEIHYRQVHQKPWQILGSFFISLCFSKFN